MNPLEWADPLIVVVAREEIESGLPSTTIDFLNGLMVSPMDARSYCERLDLSFHGFDEDRRELWEIPEVRSFVFALDERFPFWLYFLTTHGSGLGCILRCLLPPFLTPEGEARVFPARISELLTDRWGPALNQMCEFTELDPRRVEQIRSHVEDYIQKGRRSRES